MKYTCDVADSELRPNRILAFFTGNALTTRVFNQLAASFLKSNNSLPAEFGVALGAGRIG